MHMYARIHTCTYTNCTCAQIHVSRHHLVTERPALLSSTVRIFIKHSNTNVKVFNKNFGGRLVGSQHKLSRTVMRVKEHWQFLLSKEVQKVQNDIAGTECLPTTVIELG